MTNKDKEVLFSTLLRMQRQIDRLAEVTAKVTGYYCCEAKDGLAYTEQLAERVFAARKRIKRIA